MVICKSLKNMEFVDSDEKINVESHRRMTEEKNVKDIDVTESVIRSGFYVFNTIKSLC